MDRLVAPLALLPLGLILLLATPAAATAQVQLPDRLRADAMRRRCAPVTDTTAVPGLREPLFRFGVYETGRDTLREVSGAYWCIMSTADQSTALIIWREWGDAPVPGGCVNVIPYRGPPGGLRFERRGVVHLDSARVVDEPWRKGPRVAARGTVIVSEHDGRVARFICHTGRWYVAVAP